MTILGDALVDELEQEQDLEQDQDLQETEPEQDMQSAATAQPQRGGFRRDDDRRRTRRSEGEFGPLEVSVMDGNLEGAIRALKRKLSKEGVLKQLKLKRFYEKPSVRGKRKRKEAERRRRRQVRRLAKRSVGRPRMAGAGGPGAGSDQ